MHYGEIKNYDVANGIGVRVSLFVSGCRNHCENCFQPETWDFSYGRPFTEDTEREILAMLEPDYIHGLTLLGGEPMEPQNQRDLLPLLRKVRDRYPRKSIWVYTGFTLEELRSEEFRANCEVTEEILTLVDVLVDGRFDESKKDISLRFRGSSNQRLIDMRRTREKGVVVPWTDGR